MLTGEELDRLSRHLAQALAARAVTIVSHHRIHGGASRQTYSIDVDVDGVRRGLILRRDPEDSLIDTERALEFAAYRSAHGKGVPVPQAISLVEDTATLGKPFFVMERIEGGAAGSPFQSAPYGAHGAVVGEQFFAILGRINAIDAGASPLAQVVDTPAPGACWRRELDYWEGVIDADELEPHPIARAAIRRLRRTPPKPPQRLAIVHGDYRNGNFLQADGRIIAVLDWEMAHIGDPLEDLAWALDPLWSLNNPALAAGMIPRAHAIALWEENSGLRFDEDAFSWWSLFAQVKGLAIWISSSRAFVDGKNTDPVLSFSGWYCTARHNQMIAQRLAAAAPGALR